MLVMERLYNTSLTRRRRDTDVETPTGESMTVPGMSLSLRELVERYTRGQDVPVHSPYYADESDDSYYPDPREMDMADIYQMRQELNARARQLRKLPQPPSKEPGEAGKPDEVGKPQKSDEGGQPE